MLTEASVLGVPGCLSFAEEWCTLFAGKAVVIMYDNDHDRIHPTTGKTIPAAAFQGVKRVAATLHGCENPPEAISYLAWGGQENHFDRTKKHGYDVRDYLTQQD